MKTSRSLILLVREMAACESWYSHLRKFVFLVYDTTRVLAVLSLMELAMHQLLIELISDIIIIIIIIISDKF
jgi:hypothetical protein